MSGAVEGAPTEPAEGAVALEAPRTLRHGFARELTPIWLATTALLAGQEPPDLEHPFRHVHLGCGDGETVAVVAACHPEAEIWAWDLHPERLEAARRLRDAAALSNLAVHERTRLPADLGDRSADVVVIQEVLAHVDDTTRAEIARFAGRVLRPGGLVCVTYPSLVGWSEIEPVVALMRRVARTTTPDLGDSVPVVLDLLARLRDGGAAYLTERPIVKAWLDDVLALEPTAIADQYLRDEFRPLSPAQASDLLSSIACHFVGSARLADDLDVGLPAELITAVRAAPSRLLRETYRDLATRREHHVDVFRFGDAPIAPETAAARIAGLEITASSTVAPSADEFAPAVWERLRDGTIAVADLAADVDDATTLLRALVDGGHVHPVATDRLAAAAAPSCRALNAAWSAWSDAPIAAARLASAVPASCAADGPELLVRLGVG